MECDTPKAFPEYQYYSMYFPTSAARHLATIPGLPNIPPEHVVALVPSPRRSLFCLVTRNSIAVWVVRVRCRPQYACLNSCSPGPQPAASLALHSRTPTSILEHGENLDAWWSPESDRIVIKVRFGTAGGSWNAHRPCRCQTSDSYLVLVSVEYKADELVCGPPNVSLNAQRSFLAGPGEGLPMKAISLHFEGVVRVEGELLRWEYVCPWVRREFNVGSRLAYRQGRIISFSLLRRPPLYRECLGRRTKRVWTQRTRLRWDTTPG